jgi:hypothetical protein
VGLFFVMALQLKQIFSTLLSKPEVPVQRARRPPRQSTPDRLALRGQGSGGVS